MVDFCEVGKHDVHICSFLFFLFFLSLFEAVWGQRLLARETMNSRWRATTEKIHGKFKPF